MKSMPIFPEITEWFEIKIGLKIIQKNVVFVLFHKEQS